MKLVTNTDEIRRVINSLKHSNTRHYGDDLERGKYKLWSDNITCLDDLGSMVTYTGVVDKSSIRGRIAPLPPSTRFDGKLKYLVREQIPSFEGVDIDDGGHFDKIYEYINNLEQGIEIEMIICTIRRQDLSKIVDGNKRSIAHYEYFLKRKINEISFPIYVLDNS